MDNQMFLFGRSDLDVVSNDTALSEIRILTWNISNPSIERAYKQVDWLIKTKANVVILTEAKYSQGCIYIINALENFGFEVTFSKNTENDYSVIIANKGFQSEKWTSENSFLPHRIGTIILKTFLGNLRLVGLYVPSRGPKEIRNVNKKKFQNQIIDWLKLLLRRRNISDLIIGGDLNVIEPNHIPRYSVFGDWEYEFYNTFIRIGLADAYRLLYPATHEYSWFGKYGDGYRFDHFFVSRNISSYIDECHYIHDPRLLKFSDHSAVWLKLKKLVKDEEVMVLNVNDKT